MIPEPEEYSIETLPNGTKIRRHTMGVNNRQKFNILLQSSYYEPSKRSENRGRGS